MPKSIPVPCLVTQSCQTDCDPMDYSHQAPLPMGFFKQEYQSGLPCLPPGDLPDPGIELMSPALQADSLQFEPPRKPTSCVLSTYFVLAMCM